MAVYVNKYIEDITDLTKRTEHVKLLGLLFCVCVKMQRYRDNYLRRV